ncbi:MAG TPA: hypothetical protein PLH19_01830 [Anaerolineae bacterium]|nr:hypothetical protein [Anaerolineae bacterium]HQH37261.1 hypothetical protein [Anaerolineae bacterium]
MTKKEYPLEARQALARCYELLIQLGRERNRAIQDEAESEESLTCADNSVDTDCDEVCILS